MPRRTEEFESGESNEEMKNFYQSVNPIHIGLSGAVWYGGGVNPTVEKNR